MVPACELPFVLPSCTYVYQPNVITADRRVLDSCGSQASFDYVKLMNVIDGGVDQTARRHFIISPTEDTDLSDK